ncbi:MAG: protein BatD [Deltaproteobacteria bacterium]|nr:protein BatD [Deltaproteobacteria bacterium]
MPGFHMQASPIVRAASLLLVLAGARAALADEVVLNASVDRTRVALDGTIQLTISLSVPDRTRMQHLDLPNTGSLEVVRTSREESLSFSFSGGSSSYNKFENTVLTLKPTELGSVEIGPAVLRYGGKTYKTKPIRITVTKARGRPRGPTSPLPRSPFPDDDWFRTPLDDLLRRRRQPEPVGAGDIFVRAFTPSDLVVEGQQVTVSLYVYSRVGARIASVRWPKLTEFFSVDRDVTKAKTDEKYIEGVRYQYKLLDRKALFPLQPGELTIAPIEVEVEAGGSPFFPSEERLLRTRPIRIRVEPLPADGRPAGFNPSNVGHYSLSSDVDANEVSLNQPITYTLTVKGSGNIYRLRPPELPPLSRFKTFDPNVDVKVPKYGATVQGSKTFEYILVPLASGKLEIPKLEFAFYDPERGAYQVLETKAETIEVKASQGQAAEMAGREVNIVAGALKPIRFASSLDGHGPPLYEHAIFIPLLAAPPALYLLVLLGLFVRAQLQASSPASRARRAASDARRRWKKAARLAAQGQAAAFYAELERALMDAVQARTGKPAAGLPFDELRAMLREAGAAEQTVSALVREIENCDFGRFAPAVSRSEEMQSAHERVGRLLRDLGRKRAGGAR